MSAGLVVLQTLVLQVASYDSPSFGALVTLFRVAFFAADALALVAVVRVARAHASVAPFGLGAAAAILFSIASGALGLLVRVTGRGEHDTGVRIFASFAATASAAEPWVAAFAGSLIALAATALLRASGEGAPVPRLARVLATAFWIALVMWLVLGLARLSSRDVAGIAVAWVAWGLEIARALAVSGLAFVAHRALEPAHPSGADAPKVGPYREGGPAPKDDEAPADPALRAPLGEAIDGLSFYRLGFVMRLGLGTSFLLLCVAMIAARAHTLWFLFGAFPLEGVVTAGMMIAGLGRQRALPSLRGGARRVIAIVALGFAAASDVLVMFAIILGGADSGSSYSAFNKAQTAWAMCFPLTAILVGASVLLVASNLARAGILMARPALVSRARWVQSLAVLAFAALLGSFAAIADINGHDHDRKNGGALVVGLLLLATFVSYVATIASHWMAHNEALRVLRARRPRDT